MAAGELLTRAFGGRFATPGAPVDRRRRRAGLAGAHGVALGSGGERRVLRLVAALVDAEPIDIVDVVAGLDRAHLDLVLAALARAGGSHEHAALTLDGDGTVQLSQPGPLHPWPGRSPRDHEVAAGDAYLLEKSPDDGQHWPGRRSREVNCDEPTGQRMIVKPYTKDDGTRTLAISQDLIDTLTHRVDDLGLGRDDLLFPSREIAGGQPLSRATFNTRYWRPAVQRCGITFNVRMHDLRHAHASWLLAGGADLRSVMQRMGHAQIMTAQKNLHTLDDTDHRALAASHTTRTRTRQ